MSYTHALGRVAELFPKVQRARSTGAGEDRVIPLRPFADYSRVHMRNFKASKCGVHKRPIAVWSGLVLPQIDGRREDKEILDWMNGNIEAIMFKYKPDGFIWDVREIMRGAMAKEGQP